MIRCDPDQWRPREGRSNPAHRIEPGSIVLWDRKPYRLIEVRERAHADWPEEYRQKWVEHRMPDPATWHYRPVVVVLRDVDDERAKPLHLVGPAGHYWHVLPEHYSVCRLCGEIPPCTHVHTEAVVGRATERMAEEMAILPGCCHACREPITARQKSVTFPGPNLVRPDLGDDSARFHSRAACFDALFAYDERWANAAPGRKRLFYCEGRLTQHFDKTLECTEPDCPGADARHAMWMQHWPDGDSARGCWCVAGEISSSPVRARPESPSRPDSLF